MVDKEHEEWLSDEQARKKVRVSHWASIHKLFTQDQEKKKSETEFDEAQEEADDAADEAEEEKVAQEREDGFQGGLAI